MREENVVRALFVVVRRHFDEMNEEDWVDYILSKYN